jgi:hypothetical protein
MHAQIRILLLVHRAVMAGQPLTRALRKPPALIEIRVVDENVATPQHIAELIDVETIRLKVGQYLCFLRRQALGRLHQSAAVRPVAGGQLNQ